MLSISSRAHLTIVLVGARNPSNIGAAARAMQDFGFSDLRIVNNYAAPFEAAQLEAAQLEAQQLDVKSAVAAQHVMRNARRFNSLADAIADCTLIVGTTAIGDREIKQPILPLQQVAPLIHQTLSTSTNPGAPGPASEARKEEAIPSRGSVHSVALLFGSEKTGLTNDHLSHCSLLTTIPMFAPGATAGNPAPRHLSMNLGQSVAVCLYELTRSGFEGVKELPVLHEAPATATDRERLTQLLLDVLHATGYTRRFPANSSEPIIRQLTQHLSAAYREAMTHRQAMFLMGIFRQILWHERNERVTPPDIEA